MWRYGDPVERPVCCFFLFAWMVFFVCLDGGGREKGEAGDMWRVCGLCVVDGWFTASPGLSQTNWTLDGVGLHTWGA